MSLIFCEGVARFPLVGDHLRMLGTSYEDPYAPAHAHIEDPNDAAHHVDSFGWSVGDTFAGRLHALGVRWESASRIAVSLTPSLATGQVGTWAKGPPAGSWQGVEDYHVEIGLAPDEWARTTALGKRALLAGLGARALGRLADVEGWEWPESPVSAAVGMFARDEADLRELADTRAKAVAVAADAWRSLSSRAWKARGEAGRQDLADAVTRALHAAGRPLEPLGIRPFGPRCNPFPVAQWRDPEAGLTFSLICGGTYGPGLRTAQIRQAYEWYEASECAIDFEEAFRAGGRPGHVPKAIEPYFSQVPCDIRKKSPVAVAPMLLAAEPLTWGAPGLDRFLDMSRPSRRECSGPDRAASPVGLDWFEVPTLLRLHRWSLASSAEFEWAARGGLDALFPWGNVPPDVAPAGALGHDSYDPDRPRLWPWCNRFGLTGPLRDRNWCLPRDDPNDPFPLVSRGGGNAWPGQECGEWWLYLTAAECRECLDVDDSQCALRPAIRLQPSESPGESPDPTAPGRATVRGRQPSRKTR